MRYLMIIVTFLVQTTICLKAQPLHGSNPEEKKITIEEVIQVTGYTYIHAREGNEMIWIAVPTTNAKKGEEYYYISPMVMKDFESKELGRKFETIYFIAKLKPADEDAAIIHDAHAQKKPETKQNVSIEHSDEVIPIAELFRNKEKYNGKVIKVQGKVTKFTTKILYKNWVHLQDGTSDKENFDLTITTTEEVKVDEEAIFEGKISLDKDFGYGYFFAIIMEDAKIFK